MLDVAVTRVRGALEKSGSHTLTLSFEEDSEFDSAKNDVGKKLRTIFGHADCRFEARFHAEYRGNQFVAIKIFTQTHGLHPRRFACRGTTGEKRRLAGGPRLTIDDVRWNDQIVTITLIA